MANNKKDEVQPKKIAAMLSPKQLEALRKAAAEKGQDVSEFAKTATSEELIPIFRLP